MESDTKEYTRTSPISTSPYYFGKKSTINWKIESKSELRLHSNSDIQNKYDSDEDELIPLSTRSYSENCLATKPTNTMTRSLSVSDFVLLDI